MRVPPRHRPTTEPTSSRVRLSAHLDVAEAAVELALPAGAVQRLPASDGVVAALADAQPTRAHRLALDGRRLERAGRARRVRAGLLVVGPPELAADVSVRDHLAAVARPRRADALLAQIPQLASRRNDPAGVLSGGERRLLGWLAAIALAPRCVVLDRAGTGLDPASLAWAHRVVDDWLAEGGVVLVRVGRDEEARWVDTTATGDPR